MKDDAPLRAPYEILAGYYDRLLGDFSREIRPWLLEFVGSLDPAPGSVLDLACGTGRTAADLSRIVPRVRGIDLSPAMVRETRRRARAERRRVTATVGDMTSFALPEPVDLVTCLFDSLNHLPRRRSLGPVFRSVHRNLAEGGSFLFDVVTPWGLRQDWPAFHETWQGPGWHAIGRGHWEPPRRGTETPGRGIFALDWLFRRRDGNWRIAREVYREVAWTEAEIREAARRAGFRSLHRIRDPRLDGIAGGSRRGRAFYFARRDVSSPRFRT